MPEAVGIRASLQYAKEDSTRHFYYAWPRTNADEHRKDIGGTSDVVDTLVRNGRGLGLSLDQHSFELVEQMTSLSTEEFYSDPEKVLQVYYKEMEDLVCRVTGAAHAHAIHHQVRNSGRSNGGPKQLHTSVQGYAAGVHSDMHPCHAEHLFRKFARIKQGRFVYINTWRNISDVPISNNHLAVCDESSLVRPDDYITADLYGEGYQLQQYRLGSRNSAQHRWYYFPGMKKDEVLLFKHWDSDRSRLARVCFHTSFSDPDAPEGGPCRESIEVRLLAFFPDHEPDTCPPLLDGPTAYSGAAPAGGGAAGYAAKFASAVDALQAWPLAGRVWVKRELARGDAGIASIAKVLANDATNYHGLKDASPELKDEIVQLMLQGDFPARLTAAAAKLDGISRAGFPSPELRSKAAFVFKALALVALGWAIGRSRSGA